MNFVKIVRNNWKKTVLLLGVGTLSFSFVQKKYRLFSFLSYYSYYVLEQFSCTTRHNHGPDAGIKHPYVRINIISKL